MKKLMLLILVMYLSASNAYADGYPNLLGIGQDKYLHATVSAGLTAGIYFTFSSITNRELEGRLPCLIGASVFAFGIGLAKEAADAMENPPGQQNLDMGDLTADAIGVAAAAITIYFLDIHGKKKPNTVIGFNGKNLVFSYRW